MLVALVVVLCGILAPPAVAHNNGYAFPVRQVRIKQIALRYALNGLLPALGPHDVRCWGVTAVTLKNGGRGFVHIRCRVETLDVPDYIYHINSRGEVYATRSWE